MSRYKDSKNAVGKATASLASRVTKQGTISNGFVATNEGIVRVHSHKDSLGENTTLSFIVKGELFNREYKAFHTEAGLVTLADRFAAEMAEAASVWTGTHISMRTGIKIPAENIFMACRTCANGIAKDEGALAMLIDMWTVTGDDVGNDWYFCPACVAAGKVK